MRDLVHNPRCRANHMGAYACEPAWLGRALAAIKDGTWRPRAMEDAEGGSAAPQGPPPGPPYRVADGGVALVPVVGAMMKGWSKFADVDTLQVRRAIRMAVADPHVRGILLHVDSPGGSVPGTEELADDVAAAARRKPLHARIDDLGASAAYWVASQALRVSVNASGMVGSIGTYSVVYDTSKAAELEGVKVHVVATGPYKGLGADGTPVTDQALADLQRIVDATNAVFLRAIERGRGARGLRGEALAKVADGRVWLGEEARGLGLVDAVESGDEALAALVAECDGQEGARRAAEARAKVARSRTGA